MAWYIDSWDSRGGLAFASERDYIPVEAKTNNLQFASDKKLKVLQTVFICPPSFQPEAVIKRSTALWASKGHFQEGFIAQLQDNVIGEFSFDTLEQLIEVVRRTYIGGGQSPGTEPEEGPELGSKLPPFNLSPDIIEGAPEEGEWLNNDWIVLKQKILDLGLKTSHDDLYKFLSKPLAAPYKSGLLDFANRSIAQVLEYIMEYPPKSSNLETARFWIFGLYQAGLFPGSKAYEYYFNKIVNFWRKFGFEEPWLFFPFRPYLPNNKELRKLLLNGLFWRIPCQYTFTSKVKSTNLGEYLQIISSSPFYLEKIKELKSFVPLLVAGMVMAGATIPTYDLYYGYPVHFKSQPLKDFEIMRNKAATWIVQLLPLNSLSPTIDNYLDSWRSQVLKV